MVKELMHDPFFLARKSAPATEDDLETARDLLDTLAAHRETGEIFPGVEFVQAKRVDFR